MQVQLWPLAVGWTAVVLLVLLKFHRPAAVAAAGMTIVTAVVLAAWRAA